MPVTEGREAPGDPLCDPSPTHTPRVSHVAGRPLACGRWNPYSFSLHHQALLQLRQAQKERRHSDPIRQGSRAPQGITRSQENPLEQCQAALYSAGWLLNTSCTRLLCTYVPKTTTPSTRDCHYVPYVHCTPIAARLISHPV